MKNVAKSALIALLLFGATAVSQVQAGEGGSSIAGPNILNGLFGTYQGTFTAAGRTLPFDSFYLNVYPNGYVYGYLRGPGGVSKTSYVGASFYGMADKNGNFDASFNYGGKSYTLKGQVNKNKKVAGLARPYRKNIAVGVLNGTLSSTSYAPSAIGLDESPDYYYYGVYGNGVDLNFYFYGNGSFGGYDNKSSSSISGTYSYARTGNNSARLTLIEDGGATHVLLIYFFNSSYGVVYDTQKGKFSYFDRYYE